MSRHRLVLVRHAKSDRDVDMPDHERPLAKRGRRALAWLAGEVEDAGVGLIVVSSSRRTLETMAGLSGIIAAGAEVRVERALYDAGPGQLLSQVQGLPGSIDSALLVGHNPGFEELGSLLAAGGDPGALEALGMGLVTCGVLTLEADVDSWAEVGPGTCQLLRYGRPPRQA